MKLSSPPRGYEEGRRRDGRDPSSRSRTDHTALREWSGSSSSASCFTYSSRSGTGVSGPRISGERSPDFTRRRSTKKRRKAESQAKDKKAKSSKKSKKKKHHKKRRRASTSTSFSSPSSRSRSRSTSRSCSRPSSSETRRATPHPSTAASAGSDSFAGQIGVVNSRKATGWDVGPDWLEGRRLGGDAQRHVSNAKFSSSDGLLAGRHGGRRGAACEREQESVQRHDPKTYEKAFGVAVPSGQYSFVSEDTDLAMLMPGSASSLAEQQMRTTTGVAGALRLSPRSQMSTAATGVADSGGSVGQLPTAPPALGILRLLKEASEGEKAKQAQKGDNSADGLKKGSARGGPGGNKVTSKTHPHLFWQCWNCSADNYKTRHQCYRCNRLYMQ